MKQKTLPCVFLRAEKTPRIAPIAKEGRTEAQQKMLASRPDYNLYTTLAHHVELYKLIRGDYPRHI